MMHIPENQDETRGVSLSDSQPAPGPAGRLSPSAIVFPPGDLDDLIFHDSYPVYHSER